MINTRFQGTKLPGTHCKVIVGFFFIGKFSLSKSLFLGEPETLSPSIVQRCFS
jgi:hypothetical protein